MLQINIFTVQINRNRLVNSKPASPKHLTNQISVRLYKEKTVALYRFQ